MKLYHGTCEDNAFEIYPFQAKNTPTSAKQVVR